MLMPGMGESIFECTVLKWLIEEGQKVDVDDMVIEVATDKIDTEIGSTYKGKILKFLVKEGDIAVIGKPFCIIETDQLPNEAILQESDTETIQELETGINGIQERLELPKASSKFYSPLVLNIAKEEKISLPELDKIKGSGLEGRVTKDDILAYLKNKPTFELNKEEFVGGEDTIIEMDRMRMMISERMVQSRRISPHVASFVETDMTAIVKWREQIKEEFYDKTGEKITYTPILVEAVVKAIKSYPMINIQVDVPRIIKKGAINVGVAVALPDGNLIVPVIHHADQYDLVGLTRKINDLAKRARNNQLKPDELTGGTYTISNIGTFGNIAGTPIILQPQVAIMAFGVIQKKPAVIETPEGDFIGIRQKMIISHSYDHRVVDGSLGGLFVKQVSDNLEQFDTNRTLF